MVYIIDNILPEKTNLRIIEHLTYIDKWALSYDSKNPILKEGELLNNLVQGRNFGFATKTLEDGKDIYLTDLNIYGKVILDTVLTKIPFKNLMGIRRFYWNMYLSNAVTELHQDMTDNPYAYTCLYNLHTTDGGTEIDGKFYPDKMGQAKVFKSDLWHKGIPPQKDHVRFNLNIIFGAN